MPIASPFPIGLAAKAEFGKLPVQISHYFVYLFFTGNYTL